jgi:hypothetical protein
MLPTWLRCRSHDSLPPAPRRLPQQAAGGPAAPELVLNVLPPQPRLLNVLVGLDRKVACGRGAKAGGRAGRQAGQMADQLNSGVARAACSGVDGAVQMAPVLQTAMVGACRRPPAPPRPADRQGLQGDAPRPPAAAVAPLVRHRSCSERQALCSAERQEVQRGAPASLCCWCCSDATRPLSCWAAWRSDMAAPCLLSVPAAMGLGVAGSLLARWWLSVCLSVIQQIGRQGVGLQSCRRAQHALQVKRAWTLVHPLPPLPTL